MFLAITEIVFDLLTVFAQIHQAIAYSLLANVLASNATLWHVAQKKIHL